MGHYIRCLEIKNELIKRGYNVILTIMSEEKLEKKSQMYIIDLPYDMTQYIENFSKAGAKVLTLEYFDTSAIPDLNISVLDFPAGMSSASNISFGLNYIIIRNQIRNLDNKNTNNNYGHIMLGGALTSELLNEIYLKIKNLNTPIKVIINEYQNIEKINNENIEILVNPDELPNLMNGCSWCVTNGGITMLEMIYLDKNIFVYPQTQIEKRLAEIMLKNKLILSIDPPFINNSNFSLQPKLKKNVIFDGLGSKKIADKIDLLLDEL